MGIKSLSNSSGIVNFQKHQSMLAGIELNKFHHLETVRLGSSAASVEFTNLGQYSDFQHLQIRIAARAGGATNSDNIRLRFNSDTTGYAYHYLYGDGSIVGSGGNSNRAEILGGRITGSSSGSGIFGVSVVDILDPFETTKNTTVKSLSGATDGTSNTVWLFSGVWIDTSAVNSIDLVSGEVDFVSGSRFSLYGLKARA